MLKFVTVLAAIHAIAEEGEELLQDDGFLKLDFANSVPLTEERLGGESLPLDLHRITRDKGDVKDIHKDHFTFTPIPKVTALEASLRTKVKSKSAMTIPVERGPLVCACPETYELFGDHCERIVETPQETLCPHAMELQSGRCIASVRPEERCAHGFALVKGRCLRREVSVPRTACSPGYTLEATAGLTKHEPLLVCVKQIAVENILECPDGTRYNGQCFNHESVPAEFTCPPGYSEGPNGTCRRIAQVPCHSELGLHKEKGYKTLTLPTGLKRELNEEEGIVKVTVPHELPGALRGKDKLLHDKWDHDTVPRKVIDIETRCTADITIPANAYCPVGDLLGRLCRVPIPVNPVQVCPAYGNQTNCFAFDRLNPFAACPAGYKQECSVKKAHVDSYVDCECVSTQEAPATLHCPPGHILDRGACVLRADPYTGCTGVARPVSGMCQRTQTVPAICSYTVSYSCEGASCAHPNTGKITKK